MSMKKKKEITELPDSALIEAQLSKQRYRTRYMSAVRNIIIVMITVAAVIVLLTMLLMPVMRIYGKSMTPTLNTGNVVISLRYVNCGHGDVVAFYYNNRVLVKRIIAVSGDTVDIRDDGTVLVNGEELDEPYITNKGKGECDIAFPYKVPDTQFFVMGDDRSVSADSRNSEIGCISEESIISKIIFRVFPIQEMGIVR